MVQLAPPLVALVAIVGLVAIGALLWHVGLVRRLNDWISSVVWHQLPPSWPRPPSEVPPATPPDPDPDPPPDPPEAPSSGGGADPPWCPDGSGACSTDDSPVVAPVGYPPGCSKDEISESAFHHSQVFQRWATIIPLFGPLANGISMTTGGGATPGIGGGIGKALVDASFDLKEATALWQDAYVHFLQELAPEVLHMAKDVFGEGGFINVTAEYSSLPLKQAAHLLVCPVLGLLVCSAMLVWAV